MTAQDFPPIGEDEGRRPRVHPMVRIAIVGLVPCAAIAATTSGTPAGFAARFVGLALLVAFGVWCAAVWTSAFDVVMDDRPQA
jgi:hypothetical protein